MDEKYNEIIEKVEKLSVLELSQLIKAMEEKFGVSATSAMAATAPAEEATETKEKTTFTIELKNAGGAKIQVIKVIKDILGIGLKEAKDLVDAAPKVIKENIVKADAEEIKKKLEEAGAVVEIK